MSTRSIKVEIIGDFYRGKTFPRIRLQGYWLARLGFPAGGRVEVIQTSEGVLELRAVRSSAALDAIKGEVCAALERADALMKGKAQ